MKNVLSSVLILATLQTFAQSDHSGPGRAILFDGVDDYIDLGNIYDDVKLPITISAWVYVEPSTAVIQYPIFVSQDDNDAKYNGFTFVCSTLPHIGFTVGDGHGGNNPAFRRSRAGYFETLGRWVYMTAVATSETEMHTYLNGDDVSGDYQGSSSFRMDSDSPDEVAKIGYYIGNNNLLYRFKGIMDELRIWNRALSVDEIRDTMCRRLKGNETDLIGYWNFDETSGDALTDLSSRGHHGTLKGNPTRIYSGAPVGDESVFLYSDTWAGKTLTEGDLSVSNITGNAYGVHIYTINQTPSQTGGLDVTSMQLPYYGIFLADDGVGNTFDVSFNGNNVCQYSERSDNSEPAWETSDTFAGVITRIEMIPTFERSDFNISLGSAVTVCDEASYSLKTDTDPTGKTFLWNTGETASAITVSSSGSFHVEVKEGCNVDRDTILVSFLETPPSFSLGPDELLCTGHTKALHAKIVNTGFTYTWQNGSSDTLLVATKGGTYRLELGNACGSYVDHITLTEKDEPDMNLDLGPDTVICNETFMHLEANVHESGKSFQWNTGANTQSITITSSGVYSIKVTGQCKVSADTLKVTFLLPPPPFSLGEGELLCTLEPRILRPDLDNDDFAFTWHNGSIEKSLLADRFGTYWLKISNACGVSVDSVTFSQKLVQSSPKFNFISPDNQDNFNQYFMVDEPLLGAHLHVFNRWGKKVFESIGYQNNWDGQGLPAGVYFYTVSGECIEPQKGSLTIMR